MQRSRPELKTPAQIEKMRRASRIVAETLVKIEAAAKPGVTTAELDAIAEEQFARYGATSLFKGYKGASKVPYPAATCISVNEEVVHGIPGSRVLREGDIVSVDTACKFEGWCGDSTIVLEIGDVSDEVRKLHACAEETLQLAIREMRPDRRWSQIAQKMADLVHGQGYSVVEQFVGHGIGRTMHEEPQVPNYVSKSWRKNDFWLDPGLVLAVEPMVNMGTKQVEVLKDHWTVVTKDRKPSIHVEHTLAVTESGVDILTDRTGIDP